MRRLWILAASCALLALGGPPAVAAPQLRVGAISLHRCADRAAGWCGSLSRALDPGRPAGPRIRIGFHWLPATSGRATGPTLVAVEGGPGYPSTGSQEEYDGMYGPLRAHRDLLLVDARGTGSPR